MIIFPATTEGLSTQGLIIMVVSLTMVTSLSIFCIIKLLFSKSGNKKD